MALFFLHSGNSMALVMGVVLVLIPVMGILAHLGIRGKIGIRIEATVNARKGEEGRMVLTVHNPTLFPVLRTVVRIRT